MGHATINVGLTYLRGVSTAELKVEDTPMFKKFNKSYFNIFTIIIKLGNEETFDPFGIGYWI